MKEHGDYTPSELIDLFIDGEASDLEQTTLFAALAQDSDLQSTFREALEIRAAVDHDRQTVVPPSALSERVFEKAGFAMAELPVKPVAWYSRIPGAALRTGGIAILAALLGSVITAWYIEPGHNSTALVDSRSTVSSQTETVQAVPVDTISIAPHKDGRLNEQGSEQARAELTPHSAQRPFLTDANTKPRMSVPDAPAASTQSGVGSAAEQIKEALLVADNSRPFREIKPLPAQLREHVEAGPALAIEAPAFLSVELRGLLGLGLFPGRSFATDNADINNLGISAWYTIPGGHSFGVETGKELLPLFVENSEGTFNQTTSIQWLGLAYRFADKEWQLLPGVYPFAQTGIAATRSGPMSRSMLGFFYAPDSRVNFGLGLEGSVLFYGNSGNVYTAGKLGLSYIMSLRL